MVELRDVKRWNRHNKHDRDREEEELVAPEVLRPMLNTLLEIEEGPTSINQVPSEEQKNPSRGGVGGSTRSKDWLTRFREVVVASDTQVAIVEAVSDDSESAHDAGSLRETVYEHVCEEFWGEDAVFEVLGRSVKNVWDSCFEA